MIHTHQPPDGGEVGEEVSKLDKLSHQTDWLLKSHAAYHVDHVRVASFGHTFHGLYLCKEIASFASSGRF